LCIFTHLAHNLRISQLHHHHTDLDDFESQIIRLQDEGHTYRQIIDWLTSEGITTFTRTLQRRLQLWGARRNTRVKISDELAERVNFYFHHSVLSDSQIARRIADEDGI
jgi:hypothetical protein